MSKPTARFDVAAARPYTDRNGEDKKHWINVGRATQWDDGNISIELHAVPVGSWFDGKLSLFAQKEREASTDRTSRRGASSARSNDDDSNPF